MYITNTLFIMIFGKLKIKHNNADFFLDDVVKIQYDVERNGTYYITWYYPNDLARNTSPTIQLAFDNKKARDKKARQIQNKFMFRYLFELFSSLSLSLLPFILIATVLICVYHKDVVKYIDNQFKIDAECNANVRECKNNK